MPCDVIRDKAGLVTAFVCRSRGSKTCRYCGAASVALCDWSLTGVKQGKTCDIPMCAKHRNRHADLGDVDYCRTHQEMWEATQAKS